MSVQGFLLRAYFSVENGYYNFMDFLEKLRIPVYEFFVHPIENRRVPSFPVFVLILLMIIFLLAGLAFKNPGQALSLTLSVSGPQNAQVSVFQGPASLTRTVSQGSFYVFNVSKGEVLIKTSSNGFAENITTLNVESDIAITISLQPLPLPPNNAPISSLSGVQIP